MILSLMIFTQSFNVLENINNNIIEKALRDEEADVNTITDIPTQ